MAVRKLESVGPVGEARVSGTALATSFLGDTGALMGLVSLVAGCMGNVTEKRLVRAGVLLPEPIDSAAIDMVLPWLWKLARPDEPDLVLAAGLLGDEKCSVGNGLASDAP